MDEFRRHIIDKTKTETLREGIELLARERLNKAEIHKPPVKASIVARKACQVKDIIETNIQASSALIPCVSGFIIKLKRRDLPQRKNFSCAHELGHILFYDTTPRIPRRIFDYSTNEEEKVCNNFASNLLIPNEFLNDHLKSVSKNFHRDTPITQYFTIFESLAKNFQVGIEVIFKRIAKLKGIFDKDYIFIFSDYRVNYYTKKDFKLRVKYRILPANLFIPCNQSLSSIGLGKIENYFTEDHYFTSQLENYQLRISIKRKLSDSYNGPKWKRQEIRYSAVTRKYSTERQTFFLTIIKK